MVNREQERIALRELIPILVLGSQQRPLVLGQTLLELPHSRPERRHLALGRPQARLDRIQLLGRIQPGLRLLRKLARQTLILRVQLIDRVVLLPHAALPITQLLPRARQIALEPLEIASEPVHLELEREPGGGVRLPGLLGLGLERLQRALDRLEVGLALGELGPHPGELALGVVERGVFRLDGASLAPEDKVVVLLGLSVVGLGPLPRLSLALELFDEVLNVPCELFFPTSMCVDFQRASLVRVCHFLKLRF